MLNSNALSSEKLKEFYRLVLPIMQEHKIAYISSEYSGGGDDGNIDSIEFYQSTDSGGVRRLNDAEMVDIEIPNVDVEKETYIESLGWVKNATKADLPLEDVSKWLVTELTYGLFEAWETNGGASGTFLIYPDYIEMEHFSHQERYDEDQDEYLLTTLRFKFQVTPETIDDFDVDDGYMGYDNGDGEVDVRAKDDDTDEEIDEDDDE